MTFDKATAQCRPFISYWCNVAPSMGLDADDVEQALLIKLNEIVTKTPYLSHPLPVYFRMVARNCVLDMHRSARRNAGRTALEERAEFVPSSSSERNLEDAEFQIDLERAGLSKDAIRFIQVILENGNRGARAAFDTKSDHRRFYRARDEIRRFLEKRKEATLAC